MCEKSATWSDPTALRSSKFSSEREEKVLSFNLESAVSAAAAVYYKYLNRDSFPRIVSTFNSDVSRFSLVSRLSGAVSWRFVFAVEFQTVFLSTERFRSAQGRPVY